MSEIKSISTLILSVCCLFVHAQTRRWVSINTVNARPISMGGAFQSVEDSWAGMHWNPASFGNIPSGDNKQYAVRLNPLAPVIMAKNINGVDHGLSPVALTFPGFFIWLDRVCIGILTGEENLSDVSRLERNEIMNGSAYEWSRQLDIALRLRFAPRVSMGIAVQMNRQHPQLGGNRWGYRYGILIKPRAYFQAGLCYYNYENQISDTRLNLERLPDETLNIGFALLPWHTLIISGDIRNVSDDQREASLEPHMGIEIRPIQAFSLRGGVYYRQDIDAYTYSGGIGVQTAPMDWGVRFFSKVSWGADITYVMENTLHNQIEWGFLNVFVTL